MAAYILRQSDCVMRSKLRSSVKYIEVLRSTVKCIVSLAADCGMHSQQYSSAAEVLRTVECTVRNIVVLRTCCSNQSKYSVDNRTYEYVK